MGSLQSRVCIPGAALVVLFSVTAVLLNGLLLILRWKDPTKSLRSTAMLYFVFLSAFHVLYGACAGTAAAESYITCALGGSDSPHLERNFSRICLTFFIRAENFLILAFAVERLGSIAFPVLNRQESDKTKNALFCLVCISLFSLSFSVFDIFEGKFWVRRLDVHLNSIIPLIVSVVLTFILWRSLRKLRLPSTDLEDNNGISSERTEENLALARSLKEQMPLARAFIFIASLYSISVTTYFVISLIEVYCSECWRSEWFFAALRFSIAMHFMHLSVSPLVCFVFLPNLRARFRIMFCGKRGEEQIEMENLHHNNKKLGTVPVIYL